MVAVMVVMAVAVVLVAIVRRVRAARVAGGTRSHRRHRGRREGDNVAAGLRAQAGALCRARRARLSDCAAQAVLPLSACARQGQRVIHTVCSLRLGGLHKRCRGGCDAVKVGDRVCLSHRLRGGGRLCGRRADCDGGEWPRRDGCRCDYWWPAIAQDPIETRADVGVCGIQIGEEADRVGIGKGTRGLVPIVAVNQSAIDRACREQAGDVGEDRASQVGNLVAEGSAALGRCLAHLRAGVLDEVVVVQVERARHP